jgi:hypothetical protein
VTTTDIMTRFWAKTEQNGSCIEWTGAAGFKGYGRFKVNGKLVLPHRFIMEVINETTYPRDIDVRHRCDNPPCVNPSHLQPGTRSENMLDAVERGRHFSNSGRKNFTHCPQAHEFTEENTYTDKRGNRHCKRCRADCEQRRRERRKGM